MCGTDLKRKEAGVARLFKSEKLLAAANSRQARRAIVGEWGGSIIFKSPLLKYRSGSACVTCGGDTTVATDITERPQAPQWLQHSCQPTVKLHTLPFVWILLLKWGSMGRRGSTWYLPCVAGSWKNGNSRRRTAWSNTQASADW